MNKACEEYLLSQTNFDETVPEKYRQQTKLAVGDEPGRIYRVEPTGPIEDDPNLTDKKFPGDPTKSYRTQHPLRVVDEVLDWEGHSPEELRKMRDHLEELKRLGIEAINE